MGSTGACSQEARGSGHHAGGHCPGLVPRTGSWRPLKRPADPFHATMNTHSDHRRPPRDDRLDVDGPSYRTGSTRPQHCALHTQPRPQAFGPWTDDVEDSITSTYGSKAPWKPLKMGCPWSKTRAFSKTREKRSRFFSIDDKSPFHPVRANSPPPGTQDTRKGRQKPSTNPNNTAHEKRPEDP